MKPALLTCLFVSLALAPAGLPATASAEPEAPACLIKLDSKTPLLRVGAPPIEVTPDTLAAAQCVLYAVEKKDAQWAREAIRRYDLLSATQNLGGDGSGLRWLCQDLLATLRGEKPAYGKMAVIYRDFFRTNDYALLKEYLQRQYGLNQFKPADPAEHKERRALLEDYIMFMSPDREHWEASAKCLDLVRLKPGEKVLDIGCGMGYYTYKMAAQVGASGLVYAIDTEEIYLKFIDDFSRQEGLRNVKTVASLPTDIKVTEPADVAFICSLYHVIYGWATEPSRRAFLESIKRALKPDGRLVIVDNLAADGRELHSSYVDHRLVAAQLYYYGFRQELYAELSPLRYVLILKRAPAQERPLVVYPAEVERAAETNHELIRVTSGNSLVHIGSLDSYDITPGGIAAAKLALEAFQTGNRTAASNAVQAYERLIPNENFGGEFTALQWFCEYFLASPEEQSTMLRDPLVRAYYHYLADEHYGLLKDYLKTKYKLLKAGERSRIGDEPPKPLPAGLMETNALTGATFSLAPAASNQTARAKAIRPQDEAADPNVGRIRRTFLEDFILFNNPRRPQWEHTDRMVEWIGLKPGDRVADVGCGPGFLSFRFGGVVGPAGRVFAVDIKQEHLDFMTEHMAREGITNVTTVLAKDDDISLQEPVDVVFMCSLYHIIYGVAPEPVRRNFIQSIQRALKPGGRFILVDNGPVEDRTLPYHGPYLTKELAIAQLQLYGFRFLSSHQIIPQRYLLEFSYGK